MAGNQHFVYSPETVFATWVAPAKAISVESSDIGSAREVLDLRVTGTGRSLHSRVLGAKSVNGPMKTYWWPSYIASLFKNWMRDNATTGAPSTYVHAFLFDDTTSMLGYSIQQILKTTATSYGTNILSAYVSALSITAAAKEKVILDFTFEAKDEARFGANWDYSGAASSAMVANPSALYATLARPLMFYDAAISIGGTTSIAAKVISVAASTAYAKINNVKIDVALNLDTDGFGLSYPDPTRLVFWPGDRDITVSFDLQWTDYVTTFYDNARTGTAMALKLDMIGPGVTQAHVIVPSLFFDPHKLPAVTGGNEKKTVSVTGKAKYDTVTGKDFNVWIQSAEATI
jgi:hypothetical protein